jgi:uncharacterized protein (TIGR02996 family)
MNDEAGFLASLAEQPAERSTRLVYADWLDEHGRHDEAAFLRLQIEIAERSARLLDLGGQLDPKWLTAVGNARTKPEWITLRPGRSTLLREFRQWSFYEGLMAGCPTSEDNRESLERLVQNERERGGDEPYLIQPVERPKPFPDGHPLKGVSTESRGLFPAVACVGRFTSFDAARDPQRHASTLTVIWFQDEFAFPIEPAIREHIRAIDWEKHAHDFDW